MNDEPFISPSHREEPAPVALAEDRVACRAEAIFALVYVGAYLGYLFMRLESEWLHWLTLVLIPLLVLVLFQGRTASGFSLHQTLASVGLRKETWMRGLWWAALIGLAISVLQLVLSRSAGEIWELIRAGKALWLFPVTFVLMVATAGFTEEFFFRGVLQTRLDALLRSRIAGIVVTAILFGLYHLPYAYLHPNWPSYGDWGAAFAAALGQGLPMGLILGAVYEGSRKNLLACVVVHALTNALPAMTMIRFG